MGGRRGREGRGDVAREEGIERGREGIGAREKEACGLCRGRDSVRLAEGKGARINDVGLGSELGLSQFLGADDTITRP
jgi:hypothetical protein